MYENFGMRMRNVWFSRSFKWKKFIIPELSLIITCHYFRFTWVIFLATKNETFKSFEIFSKKFQKEKGFCISKIRSDYRGEFENESFKLYCEENGINHTLSCARTPQQNGVVERNNRFLQEMAKIMLCDKNLPKYF